MDTRLVCKGALVSEVDLHDMNISAAVQRGSYLLCLPSLRYPQHSYRNQNMQAGLAFVQQLALMEAFTLMSVRYPVPG